MSLIRIDELRIRSRGARRTAMLKPAAFALLLAGCFGQVATEPSEPDGTVEQAYADDTCAARPVAIVRGKVPADIVTSEPGWHYDGSDPKVRHYARPVAIERACWRVEAGTGCECRALAADESAFVE